MTATEFGGATTGAVRLPLASITAPRIARPPSAATTLTANRRRLRCGAASARALLSGHHKRGVLDEDPLLELAEVGPGLEAQLVRERRSCVPVDGERIRLAARTIEREHELTSDALAVRMPADELLELSDELRMAAECEIGVDPVLGRRQAELVETGDLVLCERLAGHVCERRASPERERIPQR